MYGCPAKVGLRSINSTSDIFCNLTEEEELEIVLKKISNGQEGNNLSAEESENDYDTEKNICVDCNKQLREDYNCSACERPLHQSCSKNEKCHLCFNKFMIENEKRDSCTNLEKQAKKMKDL